MGDLLIMAGIWDVWKGEGKEIYSFSIITTAPNQEITPLHDRMPVILKTPEEQEKYLLSPKLEEVLECLTPPLRRDIDILPGKSKGKQSTK